MARDVIDLPGTEPPLAALLVASDRGLRLGLAATFAAAAALAPGGPGPTSLACAALALALLADRLPRTTSVAGTALAAAAALSAGAPAPWLGVLTAAAVRTRLQWGPAGAHLARIRALRRTQARGVATMALRKARAGRVGEDERAAELRRAGDAFERAGRAGAELRALGAERRAGSLARQATRAAGALPPRVCDAALRWLENEPSDPAR
jgi:hypothetical protein